MRDVVWALAMLIGLAILVSYGIYCLLWFAGWVGKKDEDDDDNEESGSGGK